MARVRKKRLANLGKLAFLMRVSEVCKETKLSVASRYIEQGNCQLLGLFSGSPPWWILEVNSSFTVWAGQQRDQKILVARRELGDVNWLNWIGDREESPSTINLGDQPNLYTEYRKQARIQHGQA